MRRELPTLSGGTMCVQTCKGCKTPNACLAGRPCRIDRPFDPADILTPKELAARLKVKIGWVHEQMRPHTKNQLPHMRCGRFLRFSWEAVSDWLRKQEGK